MNKSEAIERFVNVARIIYTQHGKMRTRADYQDIYAFHIVAMRLNAIAAEKPGKQVISIHFHPYYPALKLHGQEHWYWSHGFFWKWVEWYMPILKHVSELKLVAGLHENANEYAESVRRAWEQIPAPIVAEDEEKYAEYVQLKWDELQARQTLLFGEES